jgi:type IV pilus assembly protein PilB
MQRGASAFEELLIDERALNRHDLGHAQQHAERHDIGLADALVALGLMSEERAYDVLARATGLPLVTLEEVAASGLALRLIPERVARRHLVVPMQVDNRTLKYATCRPFDIEAERDVAFASGRRVTAVLALRTAVLAALDRLYPKLGDLERLADRLRAGEVVVGPFDLAGADAKSGSPVIDFCNRLIARAVDVGASDIHIDFTSGGANVRYRICGVLEPVLTLPASATHPVRNRFKIMASADIAVHNRPQDGAFRLAVDGRPIDVRLSSLPTIDGEKLVMRVIDAQSTPKKLVDLGYDPDTLARLMRCLARPDGLMLATGPTGSGKTTALYAALDHLRTAATNIVSVEDPVERTVPGVAQIPVNARAGNTFAAILKSLLRQDPNIIMVGEVRDAEVAQIVGQAAYTGHLVLTSVHTIDAATAVTRLMNLGLEPFKIAESLSGILAQRLVRSLCPHCRDLNDEVEARRLGQLHHMAAIPASAGPGCERCKQTGYAGRVPIVELLTPSESLRATIAQDATAHEIRMAMQAAGIPTMRQRALELVAAGVTSIEEIDRVLSGDDAQTAGPRSQRRVLVVDDDAITRMLVKLLLEREQYEVLEAIHGRHAVEVAAREHPDLLLIDLNMPEMDGYQAIARMRRELSLTTMPIIVLTSEDGPGVERRVLDLGADDYIIKPFDAGVLLARVQAVFRRNGAVADSAAA